MVPKTNQKEAALISPGTSIDTGLSPPPFGFMITTSPSLFISASMSSSIFSVWSRQGMVSFILVSPEAASEARMMADLT